MPTSNIFKTTLLRRLFTGYVVVILVTTVLINSLISEQISKSSLKEIKTNLEINAALVTELVKPLLRSADQIDNHEFQQAIVALAKKAQHRVTLIAPDGTVLADSEENPVLMDNHGNRPEIIAANETNKANETRYSNTLQKNMLYFAVQVQENNVLVGYVRSALSLDFIDEKLYQLRKIVALSALISGICALLLGFYFIKRFSTPLTDMTNVAKAIAQGDHSQRIHNTLTDELGQLAQAFNVMAENSELRLNDIIADRNRLAMIFTGMVEGVIYVDERKHIIHINQAAANILNISVTASIEQPIGQQISAVEITEALEQSIRKQSVIKTQMRNNSSENQRLDEVVDIYCAALLNDIGKPIGAVIVLNDRSELDYLEHIRRDFVANASHELKTPITAIRGMTETILEDDEMPSHIRQSFMKKIKIQSIRLSSLVTDLMTISRLDANPTKNLLEIVDLTSILKGSIINLQNICNDKNVTLTVQLPDHKVSVRADPQELSQLFDNLIDNAIKYTPSLGNVNIGLTVDEKQAVIIIKDTGIGIDNKSQERIFERFYRVDKARSRELGGTGLGLSIAKNIVNKHQGEISVKSRVKHGTTFTVVLPLC